MPSSRIHHHTPDYQDDSGKFPLAYHLEMIRDQERVGQIFRALDEVLQPDSVHCELGVGTGLFAIYAATRCAKVYAVEKDPAVFEWAKQNIAASGVRGKIELVLADALTWHPPEKTDSLLVEMMSVWGINEPQVPIVNHARDHILKPDGRVIPEGITNLVELGEYDYDLHGVRCPGIIPQFSGVTAPRIKTTSAVAVRYDFRRAVPMNHQVRLDLPLLAGGVVNCARLSSIVELTPSVSFYSTDSLMPQTIVPLPGVRGRRGEVLRFSASWTCRTSLEAARFDVRKA
ncbi:methyltransferase domain-containing protein [Lewinella sp. W8]|uniref:methyltransferase domain-containing protein n=1 Tax=Lewinella sp. W8 TaxID=2528208 RepID=UPI001067D1A1|nr:methyltransferase domain-containing protein [Lewinella sp. W8]MTB53622.1 methyltransferase domain-containing protein [Lewinella sp. W8]